MYQFNSIVSIAVSLGALVFLFQNKVRTSKLWRATITPLASIIGSGFLVSAPLLIESVGVYAPLAITCSECGEYKESLSLSDRTYKCTKCGIEIGRDLNAARNLKELANTENLHLIL